MSVDTASEVGARPALAGGKVAHLTPEERVARGKAARNYASRSSHGRWVPAENRPDPVALPMRPHSRRPIGHGRSNGRT